MMFVYDVICFWSRGLVPVLWFWFSSCSVVPARAETNAIVQFSSRSWQTDEGLPQNSVISLVQTRDGYLWLGTTRGLARFDGVRFKSFTPQDTPGLQNGSITALCQSRDGSLWIGTDGGGLTELKDGKFIHHTLQAGARADKIKCILETAEHDLWVGTLDGLFWRHGAQWKQLGTNDGLLDPVVRALCETDDRLLIGTGQGLNFFKGGKLGVEPVTGLENLTVSIRAVYEGADKNIWLGLTDGLARLNDGHATLFTKKDGLPDSNVTAIHEDRRGNLWVGTSGGLGRWEEGRWMLERDKEGGFYDQVYGIIEDTEGDIWVGARDGLHQLRARHFLTYTRQEGLTHNNIMSVLEDREGNIWAATWGGGVMRIKDGRIKAFTKENSAVNGLATDHVLSLFEDQDGSILAGGEYEGGTFRYRDGKFSRLWSKEEALANPAVRVIYRDREGNLWFGANTGLVLNNSKQKFLEEEEIHCIREDHEGTLWVGTRNGLFQRKQGAFVQVMPGKRWAKRTVLALREDKDQNFWISVEHGGLGLYRNGKFTLFTTDQGLWNDEIFEILEDDHGWLWLSCPQGVFRVNKKDLLNAERQRGAKFASIAYGKADGMESIQCSGVSKPGAWRSRDGRLWFATTKGLAVTDPNADMVLNDRPPPIRIEEVLVDKHPLALAEGAPLEIPQGRGELEIHYTALSFQLPEKNRFRYRLAGVDPEWVEAGNRRAAYYNNLRPGRYLFQVSACNNDGVWSAKPVELGVMLQPHFWQMWWFSGFAGLAMAGILGGSVRFATRRKLERRLEGLEQQNAIEKERTRIAQDMHDDLGARLTEILLLNELASKNQQNPNNLDGYLKKQSLVVRDVAESLNAIVWAVSPVNDSLDRLANYLYDQVERLLAMRSIRCRFDVPDELPSGFISSEVRHNIFLTVRECLNNVIKHSGATEVWFRLRHGSASLSIVVEDNGRGISETDRAASGNGLQNMERRMKNLGGSFRLNSQPGKGTQIRLEVPLRPDADKRKRIHPKK